MLILIGHDTLVSVKRISRHVDVGWSSVHGVKRDIISVLEVIGNFLWLRRVEEAIDEIQLKIEIWAIKQIVIYCCAVGTSQIAIGAAVECCYLNVPEIGIDSRPCQLEHLIFCRTFQPAEIQSVIDLHNLLIYSLPIRPVALLHLYFCLYLGSI